MKILNSQFKKLLLVLPLVTLFFVSCEEVQEASKYDNWQARNEAFIDSLSREPNVFVATEADVDRMQVGELFRIKDDYSSTTGTELYIYCKKIVANPDGQRPLYTESVSSYYYGTLITGDRFDGNFIGYSATDQQELDGEDTEKQPTAFDSPTEFAVNGVITGWTSVLQLMKTGERWMIYVPYQSAYGTSGSTSGGIPGYSTLAFDIILDDIVTDED